jgi:hypothetical protein
MSWSELKKHPCVRRIVSLLQRKPWVLLHIVYVYAPSAFLVLTPVRSIPPLFVKMLSSRLYTKEYSGTGLEWVCYAQKLANSKVV